MLNMEFILDILIGLMLLHFVCAETNSVSPLSKHLVKFNHQKSANVYEEFMSQKRMTNVDSDGPLLLTPYIDNGQISIAKQLSMVKGIPGMTLTSFSGYLTVQPQIDGNSFFWFFPAKVDHTKAPVILWLAGGPGTSGITSLFAENGPYFVTPQQMLKYREDTWVNQLNMIYIDSPLGTGYSFTSSFRNNTQDVAQDLYIFMKQFFTIFVEYSNNEFYICGHSYGGKTAFVLADVIDSRNNVNVDKKINLKGVICLAGLVDPIHMIAFSNYWCQIGLLDPKDYSKALKTEKRIVQHLINKNYIKAFELFNELIIGAHGKAGFLLQSAGWDTGESALYSVNPAVFKNYETFVTRHDIRKAIHVGNVKYDHFQTNISDAMANDYLKSVVSVIGFILDKGYKVMMMSGNMDIYTIPMAYYNITKQLHWKHADSFSAINRVIWKVNSADLDFAGYVTQSENLCHVLVRNAGHRISHDATIATANAIIRFIYNISFETKS